MYCIVHAKLQSLLQAAVIELASMSAAMSGVYHYPRLYNLCELMGDLLVGDVGADG